MSDQYLGEIRIFAGTYAPVNWAFCNGQLISIDLNQALFALLGTNYGGDGRTTFALPDMRGRIPVHGGSGMGLTPRSLGSRYGSEQVTLTQNELPRHTHALIATSKIADSTAPADKMIATLDSESRSNMYRVDSAEIPDVALNIESISQTGGSQAHTNMMPYTCVNFIIATQGIFPPRN